MNLKYDQLVTFSFLPGKTGEALALYRDLAIPLYEKNEAMLSFRGFREIESPIPLDLIVVTGFKGLAGMDEANNNLRTLAKENGTSIGIIYGGISAVSSGHTDQFVEMIPSLGTGDSSSKRLTAFIWYQILPGQNENFENALERIVQPWENGNGISSATGRFLISDGWHYLRFLAFDTLENYQNYWAQLKNVAGSIEIDQLTVRRREVIVASIPELSIR